PQDGVPADHGALADDGAVEDGAVPYRDVPPEVAVDETAPSRRCSRVPGRTSGGDSPRDRAAGSEEEWAGQDRRPAHLGPAALRAVHQVPVHGVARPGGPGSHPPVPVGDQRVAPSAEQVHRNGVVPPHVPDPAGVLPPHDYVGVDPALQSALLLAYAVAHELTPEPPVVELVAEPRQHVGAAQVDSHVEVVPREDDRRRVLGEEDRGYRRRGPGRGRVPEEDAVGVRPVQGQEEVVVGTPEGREAVVGTDGVPRRVGVGGPVPSPLIALGVSVVEAPASHLVEQDRHDGARVLLLPGLVARHGAPEVGVRHRVALHEYERVGLDDVPPVELAEGAVGVYFGSFFRRGEKKSSEDSLARVGAVREPHRGDRYLRAPHDPAPPRGARAVPPPNPAVLIVILPAAAPPVLTYPRGARPQVVLDRVGAPSAQDEELLDSGSLEEVDRVTEEGDAVEGAEDQGTLPAAVRRGARRRAVVAGGGGRRVCLGRHRVPGAVERVREEDGLELLLVLAVRRVGRVRLAHGYCCALRLKEACPSPPTTTSLSRDHRSPHFDLRLCDYGMVRCHVHTLECLFGEYNKHHTAVPTAMAKKKSVFPPTCWA
ncbi:hypothetical protein THAOC_30104, partial [Thalassiosira oceanica]